MEKQGYNYFEVAKNNEIKGKVYEVRKQYINTIINEADIIKKAYFQNYTPEKAEELSEQYTKFVMWKINNVGLVDIDYVYADTDWDNITMDELILNSSCIFCDVMDKKLTEYENTFASIISPK